MFLLSSTECTTFTYNGVKTIEYRHRLQKAHQSETQKRHFSIEVTVSVLLEYGHIVTALFLPYVSSRLPLSGNAITVNATHALLTIYSKTDFSLLTSASEAITKPKMGIQLKRFFEKRFYSPCRTITSSTTMQAHISTQTHARTPLPVHHRMWHLTAH